MLGEYWYFLYFDQPYYLTGASTGYPVYMNKLQVYQPDEKLRHVYELEKFVDKRVEIAGEIGWGYAESNIIQTIAITEL